MFGERLKTLRNEKKMLQKDLAKLIKVSPSTIGMYEPNQRYPDASKLIFLAKYFNVSVDYLFGISNEPIEKVMDEIVKLAEIRSKLKNS